MRGSCGWSSTDAEIWRERGAHALEGKQVGGTSGAVARRRRRASSASSSPLGKLANSDSRAASISLRRGGRGSGGDEAISGRRAVARRRGGGCIFLCGGGALSLRPGLSTARCGWDVFDESLEREGVSGEAAAELDFFLVPSYGRRSYEGPGGDLSAGEFDRTDAEGEAFAAIERQVGGAGEFETSAEFGELVASQFDADELTDGDLPERGDIRVEIGARVGEVELGGGTVGKEEVLLGFHVRVLSRAVGNRYAVRTIVWMGLFIERYGLLKPVSLASRGLGAEWARMVAARRDAGGKGGSVCGEAGASGHEPEGGGF